MTIALRPEADADLEIWRDATRSVGEVGAARAADLLGASTRPGRARDTVAVSNRTGHGEIVYADVFLGEDVATAGYDLAVRAYPVLRG